MRLAAMVPLVFILSACANGSYKPPKDETAACMNYRSMMTAPMPPDAMKQLQKKCAVSRR